MKSTKSKAAIAFVAFILVFSITHFAKFPGSVEYFKEITNDQPLLDLKPEFSKSGVYERLESFGNEGRTAYLQLLPTIDLIFPISAFIFFLMLGRLAAERYDQPFCSRFYWAVPSLYLLMDFLENAFIVLMLIKYPERLDSVASMLGFITVIKRILMIFSIGSPLILLSFAWFRNVRQSHTPPTRKH